jgi:hypothetical protein
MMFFHLKLKFYDISYFIHFLMNVNKIALFFVIIYFFENFFHKMTEFKHLTYK